MLSTLLATLSPSDGSNTSYMHCSVVFCLYVECLLQQVWTTLLACRYRHTAYHKQTKNQWARDDPAYVIICCLLVAVAAFAYCVAWASGTRLLHLPWRTYLGFGPSSFWDIQYVFGGTGRQSIIYRSFWVWRFCAICRFGHELWHSLITILSAVVIDFLLVGCGIATAGWWGLPPWKVTPRLWNRNLNSVASFLHGLRHARSAAFHNSKCREEGPGVVCHFPEALKS